MAWELRTVKDKGVFDFTPRDIAEVKAKAEEAGLSICGISAPFYKCELTDEKEIAESLRGAGNLPSNGADLSHKDDSGIYLLAAETL